MTPATVALIEEKLHLDWSPEQVSGGLKEPHGIHISHERRDQYIWSDRRQ